MSTSFIKLAAAATLASLTLVACGDAGSDSAASSSTAATSAATSAESTAAANGPVTIEDNHGTVEVPANPQRVVSLDNRSFELLDEWGVELVAAPKPLVPATLPNIKENDDIIDLGTHREPDLEALVAAQPDLIITGQRFGKYYEEIKKLNPDVPIIELEPRDGEDLGEELKRQTLALGKVFGKETEAQKLVDDFDAATEKAAAAYNGEDTVMAVNVSGGKIGYIAPSKGRTFGPIFDMLKLTPALEVANASDNHEGDDISVEAIAESNPKWIFVLDRDGGTNAAKEDTYKPALEVIQAAEALQNVDAIRDEHVLVAPQDTYTNESIITYTEILNSIADAFSK